MAEETLVENLVADSVELIKRSTNKGTTPPMSFGTSILMRKNGAYLLRDRPSTSSCPRMSIKRIKGLPRQSETPSLRP